jgi:hypothetical protein
MNSKAKPAFDPKTLLAKDLQRPTDLQRSAGLIGVRSPKGRF